MKFTKKAFAEWLNGKRARESVGQPEHTDVCPLCNFLKSQGAKSVVMNVLSRTVNDKQYLNPQWAIAFQESICNHVGNNEDSYITARTAVKYLN